MKITSETLTDEHVVRLRDKTITDLERAQQAVDAARRTLTIADLTLSLDESDPDDLWAGLRRACADAYNARVGGVS